MSEKRLSYMDFAVLRRVSGEVLSQNANRLRLTEAIMIAVTPLLLYSVLLSAYSVAVLPMLDPIKAPLQALLWEFGFGIFLGILTLLFSLPLSVGVLWMAADMEAGRESDLRDVFRAFSSLAYYRRAVAVSWAVLWRVLLLVVAESLIAALFALLPSGFFVFLLQGLLMTVTLFLWGILMLPAFFSVYFITDRVPREMQARMRPLARSLGFRYWLGFLPWLLLSILTFCILLLADVLPRMLIAYFRLSRRLNKTIQSEELNHE